MTDTTTTAPISIRPFSFPRPSLPKLAIAEMLVAIAECLGDAFRLAYLDPYTSAERRSPVLDEDLEGRDPDW